MSFPSKITKEDLFHLYFVKKLTYQEIADIYGLSVSAISRRMKFIGFRSIPTTSRYDNTRPIGDGWKVFLGCIMGDGHLNKGVNATRIELKHSVDHADYLDWKLKKLSPPIEFNYKNKVINRVGKDTIHAASLSYQWISDLYSKFYDENKNRIVDDYVLSEMDEVSLAIWYLDDGNYNTCRWNNYITMASLRYGKNGNEKIKKWLYDRWSLNPSIYKHPSRKEKYSYSLQFTKKDSEFIREITKEVVKEVPSMKYKIEPTKR